jgi:DNA-binding NarL/FixJ family response regulator
MIDDYWSESTFPSPTQMQRTGSSSGGKRLNMSLVRVLVVEDYELFRSFICSTLRERAELQLVGEAADGLEAVQKAHELQPHLIVLDIGLPSLNGIEVARRIRKLLPQSKILFVSQETCALLAEEAFNLGAMGYVVKEHAASELLVALDAVCQGRRFVSKGLSLDRAFVEALERQPPDLGQTGRVPLFAGKAENPNRHEVQFYWDDESLIRDFTYFIKTALAAGNAVIAVATESHRNSLLSTLQACGVDVATAIAHGRYIPLDVAETLSTFMVNDVPDPVRFVKVASDLVARAAEAATGVPPRVAACGECAPTLWAQGKIDAAIQVERLWDGIAQTFNVDILCGYLLKDVRCGEETLINSRICAEHSAVYSGPASY